MSKNEKGKIWESSDVKLLGVTFDNKLNFDSHIARICLKTSQKLSVIGRLVLVNT